MRSLFICLGSLALLLAAAGSAQAGDRIRVAVLPFENASADEDLAALGKGLQAMITTDLHEAGAYDLVERSRLADIQAELSLTKTGAIDKATAAKIGKLAGASHLLTGTVTVVGDDMRIDARIFATESGDILLAEKIEGKKTEFFDLEKTLVKKLVGVTGVTLTPKERVKVGRVATADFQAFKTFSQGIQAYDKKDFDKSVELMKRAAEIDPDFTLASLTLEQYQQEIASMKTRAIAVDIDKRRAAEIAENAGARAEIDELAPFWKLAQGADKLQRLWGLYNLYYHYNDSYERLRALHQIEDRFELERTADALAGQYLAESQALFPRVSIAPDFDHHWDWNREPDNDRDRKEYAEHAISTRKDWRRLCNRLHLDSRRCGDLMLSVAEKLKKAGADKEDLAHMLMQAAEEYRGAADPDAATIAFSAAQKLTTDSYRLGELVKEVEANRDVKQFLAGCKSPWAREVLLLDGWHEGWKGECNDYTFRDLADPPNLDGARRLTRARTLSTREMMLVGDHPVWCFAGRDMRTGPRTTRYSTDSLIYYQDKERMQGVLSIVDGRKAEDLSFGLEVAWKPIPTWYPPEGYSPRKGQTEAEYDRSRPQVVIAFDLVDVDVAQRDDAETGKRRVGRPMRGYGVLLDGDRVALVQIDEDPGDRPGIRTNDYEDLNLAWKKLHLKELASKSGHAGGKPAVPVKLDVKGTKVRVDVGGESYAFDLPKAQPGYYGVWLDGPGYASFGKLKVK